MSVYLMPVPDEQKPCTNCPVCHGEEDHEYHTRNHVPLVVFSPEDALDPAVVVLAPSGLMVEVAPWVRVDEAARTFVVG